MTFRIALSGAQQAKLLLVGALATGVLATVAGRGTMAYFTTQVTSTPNTFTAGTLRLEIADVNDARSINPVTSSIVFNNIKPGDTVYAPIELTNTGTLDLKYGLKYTTATTAGGDQDLAPALKLAINSSVGGTGTKATVAASAATACSSANFTDALVWPDAVRASAFMVAGAGQTIVALGTDPAPVAGRSLAVDAVDTLCLEVTMPAATDNTYNNAIDGKTNTIVTFTVDGLAKDAAVNRGAGQ
ncbi:MAG TPA: TasA family protein [Chloroflexota bacterium]